MNIVPYLARGIPAYLASQLIGKANPKMKKYFELGSVAGYGVDAMVDFLRNQAQTSGVQEERERLEAGGPQLRPDETAAREQNRREQRIPGIIGRIGRAAGDIGAASALSDVYSQRRGAMDPEQGKQIEPEAQAQGMEQQQPQQEAPQQMQAEPQQAQQPSGAQLQQQTQRFPQFFERINQLARQGIPTQEIANQIRGTRLLSGFGATLEQRMGMDLESIIDMILRGGGGGQQQGQPQMGQPQGMQQGQGQPMRQQQAPMQANMANTLANLQQQLGRFQRL